MHTIREQIQTQIQMWNDNQTNANRDKLVKVQNTYAQEKPDILIYELDEETINEFYRYHPWDALLAGNSPQVNPKHRYFSINEAEKFVTYDNLDDSDAPFIDVPAIAEHIADCGDPLIWRYLDLEVSDAVTMTPVEFFFEFIMDELDENTVTPYLDIVLQDISVEKTNKARYIVDDEICTALEVVNYHIPHAEPDKLLRAIEKHASPLTELGPDKDKTATITNGSVVVTTIVGGDGDDA